MSCYTNANGKTARFLSETVTYMGHEFTREKLVASKENENGEVESVVLFSALKGAGMDLRWILEEAGWWASRKMIFTDGSFSSKGVAAGYGFVVTDEAGSEVYSESGYLLPTKRQAQTSQRGELMAAIAGLEWAKKEKIGDVEIVTDSTYVRTCAETYGPAWKKNGWKLTNSRKVNGKKTRKPANLDLVKKLLALVEDMDVKFRHVRGHKETISRDGRLNDIADKLAVEGRIAGNERSAK